MLIILALKLFKEMKLWHANNQKKVGIAIVT